MVRTDTKDYVINVTNVADNSVGTISDSDSNTSNNSVAENAAVGDATNLTATATDADTGATIRAYELTDDAGGLFAINPISGAVTVNGALDYETATSHTITVKATSTDGDTNTQNFTISVANVADSSAVLTDSNSAANTVSESASVGATVGVTALATDADTGATISSYALTARATLLRLTAQRVL